MELPFVAIVHHHLRPGGVTRVIGSVSALLAERGISHRILSGRPAADPGLPVSVVPELDYDTSRRPAVTPAELIDRLRAALRPHARGRPILWHLHNAALGKTRALSEAIALLARGGEPLLLQHHDFAEDGRPDRIAALAGVDELHPVAPQIVHGVLNTRDLRRLLAAGLPASAAVLLPNPVRPPVPMPPAPPAEHPPLVFQPVRGIRRKNLGETFLLAALAPPGTRFAVGRPPGNPHWRPVHEAWLDFARSSGLPVELGVVDRLPPAPGAAADFASWIRHATHLLTTSVAEGFGFAFLEPATLGRPLIGRELSSTLDDLARAGLRPGRLYRRLLVPEDWIGRERLAARLREALSTDHAELGRSLSDGFLARALDALRFDGRIDFGNLPEDLQREVIRRAGDPCAATEILAETDHGRRPLGDWLAEILARREPTLSARLPAPYHPPEAIARLRQCYTELTARPSAPPTFLSRERVLDAFLQPESFHFLCR